MAELSVLLWDIVATAKDNVKYAEVNSVLPNSDRPLKLSQNPSRN